MFIFNTLFHFKNITKQHLYLFFEYFNYLFDSIISLKKHQKKHWHKQSLVNSIR